jgi:hypothetical protein|tara:strand:- start:215 stop:367 length:153 start_codon:yes stop_codon:yes gene_type:complete
MGSKRMELRYTGHDSTIFTKKMILKTISTKKHGAPRLLRIQIEYKKRRLS